MLVTVATKRFAILGHPLNKSMLPRIHNACFRARELDAVCIPLPVPAHQLGTSLNFLKENFHGLAVTNPYMSQISLHIDSLDPDSLTMGRSVNTLTLSQNSWIGYNTLVQGFIDCMRYFKLGAPRSLVMGTSIYARAAIIALLSLGAKVTLYSPNVQDAQTLLFQIGAVQKVSVITSLKSPLIDETFELLVKTDETAYNISRAMFKKALIAFDYLPDAHNSFLEQAKISHCRYADGLRLAIFNALASQCLWFDSDRENDPPELMETIVNLCENHHITTGE